MTLVNKIRPRKTLEPFSHPPPPPTQEPQQVQPQYRHQHPHPQQSQQRQQTLLLSHSRIETKVTASIHQIPSLMPTSHRPINITELDKTPPFFWSYPTVVKTKRHGTVTVYTPEHMRALITWYRHQSGEYPRSEMRGLPSRLDVDKPTERREEYDAGWKMDLCLRQREDMEGEEEQKKEDKDQQERKGGK